MIITFFTRPLRTLEKVGGKEEAADKANTYSLWGGVLLYLAFPLLIAVIVYGPSGYTVVKLGIFAIPHLISKVCNDLSDAFKHISLKGTITKVEKPQWWGRKWRLDPLPPLPRSW